MQIPRITPPIMSAIDIPPFLLNDQVYQGLQFVVHSLELNAVTRVRAFRC